LDDSNYATQLYIISPAILPAKDEIPLPSPFLDESEIPPHITMTNNDILIAHDIDEGTNV